MRQVIIIINKRGEAFTINIFFVLMLVICSQPVSAFQTSQNDLVDSLTLPRDMEVNWVGRDLVQNGHRLQILKFRSRLDSEEIINYFNTRWSEFADNSPFKSSGNTNVVLSSVGSWKTIGVMDSDRQIVVQVQRLGSSNSNNDTGFISTGFISSMELQAQTAYTRIAFAHPSGSILLSTTHSNDNDKDTAYTGFEATTSVVMVPGSVDGVTDFYRSHMIRNGWILQTDHSTGNASAQMYTRSGETTEISFNRQSYDQVFVTLNRISKRHSP